MTKNSSETDTVERHFWLMRSVARVMGANLTDAMARGHLDADGFATMIAECQAGGCQARCERWLSSAHPVSQAAPDHCAIAEHLNRLPLKSD